MARGSDEKRPDRQELVNYLKEHGWGEEKANELLADKVGLRTLDIPGAHLLDVLKAVCQEGVLIGNVSVLFLVPNKNWEAFRKGAEEAMGKRGGFVVTRGEKAQMDSNPNPDIFH